MRIFRTEEEVKTFRCLDFQDGYSKRLLEKPRTSGYLRGLDTNEFLRIGTRSYSSALNGQGKISLLLGADNSVLAVLRAPNIERSLYEINSAFLNEPNQLEELFADLLDAGLTLVSQNYFSLDTLGVWKSLGSRYSLNVIARSGNGHEPTVVKLDDAIAYVEDPDSYRNNYQLSLRK